jgi:hypothetical protein
MSGSENFIFDGLTRSGMEDAKKADLSAFLMRPEWKAEGF